MLLLSKSDIKKVFTMQDAIEVNKQGYKLLSQGKSEVPIRTVIQAPKQEGTFLFMPAYVEDLDCASLKVVNIFPNNDKQGLPTAPAQVMLIDGKTGIVESILDGTYITQIRTAAASGAAFDVLAVADAKIGALIGVGSQAEQQLEAMLVSRPLEVVKVYSRNKNRREEFVKDMQEKMKAYTANIISVDSSDEAINDADIIVTITSSSTPVFDGKKVKEGATISGVGSYQKTTQEIDSETMMRANKIYFDSKEAIMAEAGDIIIPLNDKKIQESDLTGEIGEFLLGDIVGRENDKEIIVYKNVGVGILDLMTARAIYIEAKNRGIGTTWQD